MKRELLFLAGALAALTALTGCGENAAEQADGTAPANDTEVTPEVVEEVPEEAPYFPTYLPESDFGGAEFRFGTSTDTVDALYAEEITGELLNDTVCEVRQKVEETYNVSIYPIIYGGNSGDITGYVSSMVSAGDDTADVVMGHDCTMFKLSLSNYFLNFFDMPYQDMTQPWYPRFANDQYEINNKQYICTSYLSYRSLAWARGVLYNQQIVDNYHIENLYDLVEEKEWTLDKMLSIAGSVSSDENGNGQKDAEDLFGWVGYYKLYGFQSAFVNCYDEDADGVVSVHYDAEKFVDVVSKVSEFFASSPAGYLTGNEPDNKLFSEGRALFFYVSMDTLATDQMRDSDVPYGIIPVPLYNNAQQDYVSPTFDTQMAFPITIPADRRDVVSLVFEALGSAGFHDIRTTYFDTILSDKYTRDEKSVEMLDIIGNALMIDLAYLNTDAGINGLGRAMMYCISNPNTPPASYLQKIEKPELKRIELINEYYGNNAEE